MAAPSKDRATSRMTFSLTDTSIEQVRKLGELFQMQPSAIVAQAIARWFHSEPVALLSPGVAAWFYNPNPEPEPEESNGAGNSEL
jgi:hypothetical protein